MNLEAPLPPKPTEVIHLVAHPAEASTRWQGV